MDLKGPEQQYTGESTCLAHTQPQFYPWHQIGTPALHQE